MAPDPVIRIDTDSRSGQFRVISHSGIVAVGRPQGEQKFLKNPRMSHLCPLYLFNIKIHCMVANMHPSKAKQDFTLPADGVGQAYRIGDLLEGEDLADLGTEHAPANEREDLVKEQ